MVLIPAWMQSDNYFITWNERKEIIKGRNPIIHDEYINTCY